MSPRCGGSALARLFIQVGSAAGCCDHHVSISLWLRDWCMPSVLVIVGLINIWHGCQRQIGCAIGHSNEVAIKCVTGTEASVELVLNIPSECPEFGVQPIGSMGSQAIWICTGEWTLWMAHGLGPLVCAANGLTWHPNPLGVAIVQDLHKLGMPCCSACDTICPLWARFVVQDVLTHVPR